MRHTLLYGMLACLVLQAGIPAFGQNPKVDLPPGFDQYVAKVLGTFHVPGMAISVVKDGKVILAKGYGVRKIDDTTRVDAHTLFLIASNSKAFTATALAMLVEEGKLKWEDPVIDYLPWFRMSDPYVTMHMTVRDLLVHRSGIQAYAGDLMLFPPSDYSRRELLGKLKQIPLVRGFRTEYAYDNILYLAAGEIVKVVSGIEWEDFIRTRILTPLGMAETISRFSELASHPNHSIAHGVLNGKTVAMDHFMETAIGDASDPAGGICSNANDFAQWLITQVDSGMTARKTRLFASTTTAELWLAVTPMPIGRAPSWLKPAQMSFWNYALGFRTYNYGASEVVGHGGKLDGFVSQVAMIPSKRLGIAVFTNQESTGAYWSVIYHLFDFYLKNPDFDWIGGYKRSLDSANVRLDSAHQKLVTFVNNPAPPSLPIEAYTGLYHDTLYGDISIRQEMTPGSTPRAAGLVLRFAHSPALVADLVHFQRDSWIAKFRNPSLKADSYVNFALNADGSIDQVKLHILDPDSDLGFDDLLLKPKPAGAEKKH